MESCFLVHRLAEMLEQMKYLFSVNLLLGRLKQFKLKPLCDTLFILLKKCIYVLR